MSGYNHYPDCKCGWCVNYSNVRATRVDYKKLLSNHDSKRLLRDNRANEHPSTCFIIPNAECPVCGDFVYFYCNSNGSRVFFDDLGPPWPKHFCTDNKPQILIGLNIEHKPIKPRLRGIKVELSRAATQLGYLSSCLGLENETVWRLMIVESIERVGWENKVLGRFVDEDNELKWQFFFTSSSEVIFEGDIISISEIELSIIHPRKLSKKKYKLKELCLNEA